MVTWCEELTHLKIPWCWERLRAGGKGADWRWDFWMASPTQWTWVWVDSGNWWWTGRPVVLQSMGSQRVRHDWVTELNWTELNWFILYMLKSKCSSKIFENIIICLLDYIFTFIKNTHIHFHGSIYLFTVLFHWSVCLSFQQ